MSLNETIGLKQVSEAAVRQKLLKGYYHDLRMGPPLRHFTQSVKLVGENKTFTTADQQVIKYLSVVSGSRCGWCRKIVDQGICCPTRIVTIDDEWYVWGQGTFCCFEHAAAVLVREGKWAPTYRNTNYTNSWQLLIYLFNRMYPGETLVPSNDYPLYLENEEAVVKEHALIPLNGLSYHQIPRAYQMTK